MSTKPPSGRQRTPTALERLHPNAAGIDIGAVSHFVAVPEDRDDQPVREFPSYTADLYRVADWLQACRVKTVAMESTGVYWIPLYQVLEERGFTVRLVDARKVRNVSGRKSDVQDCQWLQQLHTYGLLAGCFRPDDETVVLRTYSRQREELVRQSGQHLQRMQKALEQMNVKLTEVIADIGGETGQKIINAILAGERRPAVLATLRDPRCKQEEETFARALHGHYRGEHIFAMKQSQTQWLQTQALIRECDVEIERLLKAWTPHDQDPPQGDLPANLQRRQSKHGLSFDARDDLAKMAGGVDLTAIPGLSTTSVFTILSETGTDMSRFGTAKRFASWLGLAPDNKISGGKILSSGTRPCANRASKTFRLAAYGMHHAKSSLGAYYRRMRAKLGAPKAITAVAHKLARIFFTMLATKRPFTDIGQEAYEQHYKNRAIKAISRQAKDLGFTLTPIQTAT
jgi:transposase